MMERRWWSGRGTAPIDPATGYGLAHEDALPLSSLDHVPCLVLLGDSGLGKSHAVDAACERLKAEERKVIRRLLSAADNASEVQGWITDALKGASGETPIHLFLDGLDEFIGDLRQLVNKLTDILLVHVDELPSLRLRIVCRSSALPPALQEGLARAYGKKDVQARTLLPLTEAEVPEVARDLDRSVTEETLNWLRSPQLAPLSARPLVLRLLLDMAREPHSAAAAVGPFAAAVSWLARDSDMTRRNASAVDMETRLRLARVIAVMVVLGEKNRVDLDDPPRSPATAITVADLRAVAAPEVVREVVRHAQLFHEGAFIHRSVAEWLAAEQLGATRDIDGIVKLLLGPEPQGRVVPQLRGLAVFLAQRRRLFPRLVARDPFTLLEVSPAELDDDQREALLDAVFDHPDDPDAIGGWESIAERIAARAPLNIAAKLEAVVFSNARNVRKRRLAIELIERCGFHELVARLVPLALGKDDVRVRFAAARVVATLGTPEERRALAPLLDNDPDEVDDQLKGAALCGLWPGVMSTTEMFAALPPPRNRWFFGAYADFVHGVLIEKLSCADLAVALPWAASSLRPRHEWPPSDLMDRLIRLALDSVDQPQIVAALCSLLRAQSELDMPWPQSMQEALRAMDDAPRRRARRVLLESLLQAEASAHVTALQREAMTLADVEDLPWLLDEVGRCTGTSEALVWLQAAMALYWPSAEKIPVVTERLFAMAEESTDPNVRRRLRVELCDPWDLEVEPTRTLRLTEQRRRRDDQERRTTEQRLFAEIEGLLAQATSGDTEAFWRAVHAINSDVRAGGQVANWRYRRLTGSLWWALTTAESRERFVAAAREYLLTADPLTEEWFGKGKVYIPAIAGRHVLMLLQEVSAVALDALPRAVCERWTPTLLDPALASEEGPREMADALLRRVYKSSPEAYRAQVLSLARGELDRAEAPWSLRAATPVYDRSWWSGLRELLDHPSLDRGAARTVLQALAAIDGPGAEREATALVARGWEADGYAMECAVEAAGFLLRRAPDASWAMLAPRFASKARLGLRVARLVSGATRQQRFCPPFETHGALGGFYRWARREDVTTIDASAREGHDEDTTVPPVAWMLSAAREALASMGTLGAVETLEELRRAYPTDEALSFALAEAREQCLLAQWRGWPLAELLRVCGVMPSAPA